MTTKIKGVIHKAKRILNASVNRPIKFSQEEGDALLKKFENGVGGDDYVALCEVRYCHKLVSKLKKIDPFSKEYQSAVMEIYRDVRGKECIEYAPEKDEQAVLPEGSNPHINSSVWEMQNTNLVSEFFHSWGQILKHLDAQPGHKVLEYGPGTGQMLLFLARCGVKAYGVDVNESYLNLIRQQSTDLRLDVKTDKGVFGEGFEGEKFDRVLFFEAFHHAFDFETLLLKLHDRLNPNGKIVFCGEPILKGNDNAVPYPWGLRLDGLSVYCIRKNGWMELGFQHDTFIEALNRCGWSVTYHPFHAVGRANVYVAEPVWDGLDMSRPIEFGKYQSEWNEPEANFRWTKGKAEFFLPVAVTKEINITVEVSNYTRAEKRIELSCGRLSESVTLVAGASGSITLNHCKASSAVIKTNTTIEPGDNRKLGIAVRKIMMKSVN
ncbi:hypothetical protein GZ77_05890 [Endozoicomonas montiporae]|uniref:Methyltransferase type 11 domain-containing protein n=2 Tax=Endozoicomonas montiporae TaxID=1027273 RepID=A0A081NC32_9GAMM|nr:class I SAM-dependent methyltransferase [Endozoicomonas montiporae]AMO56327.1 methyltransferase type 12 [Endozoicomonas montiporae CL-33]KEQ16005.1 hypothetical protein GZ77_05890 [Endozoicomonas montiporae]